MTRAAETGAGTITDSGCVFCELKGRNEDLVLHRGRLCYVILNLYPYNNGHLMVRTQPSHRRTGRHDRRRAHGVDDTRAPRRDGSGRRRTARTGSTSASISAGPPAPASRNICTCTWCRGGTATPTSWASSRTPGCCRKISRRRLRACGLSSNVCRRKSIRFLSRRQEGRQGSLCEDIFAHVPRSDAGAGCVQGRCRAFCAGGRGAARGRHRFDRRVSVRRHSRRRGTRACWA